MKKKQIVNFNKFIINSETAIYFVWHGFLLIRPKCASIESPFHQNFKT